ncbi:hypothetical protein HBI56_024030 [Parastagonospora nodorum]|nr:hypothetical protein HBH56_024480 [Parastagonospora nodorum]KAH3934319.1 hypothetical protein HBH54_057530 [Parastagonospora nodorum]KAH3949939.1 hypothetical protein HBH53_085220 [Parastagonospora nodorum]KAH3975993.1 hypothetical protein HBH51_080140 [Parastagonospora nodorum]KAH3984892.1 hypothetical protein HBH52_056330 [Parastagonospora nodorum]
MEIPHVGMSAGEQPTTADSARLGALETQELAHLTSERLAKASNMTEYDSYVVRGVSSYAEHANSWMIEQRHGSLYGGTDTTLSTIISMCTAATELFTLLALAPTEIAPDESIGR